MTESSPHSSTPTQPSNNQPELPINTNEYLDDNYEFSLSLAEEISGPTPKGLLWREECGCKSRQDFTRCSTGRPLECKTSSSVGLCQQNRLQIKSLKERILALEADLYPENARDYLFQTPNDPSSCYTDDVKEHKMYLRMQLAHAKQELKAALNSRVEKKVNVSGVSYDIGTGSLYLDLKP